MSKSKRLYGKFGRKETLELKALGYTTPYHPHRHLPRRDRKSEMVLNIEFDYGDGDTRQGKATVIKIGMSAFQVRVSYSEPSYCNSIEAIGSVIAEKKLIIETRGMLNREQRVGEMNTLMRWSQTPIWQPSQP